MALAMGTSTPKFSLDGSHFELRNIDRTEFFDMDLHLFRDLKLFWEHFNNITESSTKVDGIDVLETQL